MLELPRLLGPPARARRLRAPSGGTELVHTLNGTACAVARTLVFLFEHYQEPDGSFRVPEVLQPFLGGLEVVDAPKG